MMHISGTLDHLRPGKPVSLESKHTRLYELYRQRLTEIPTSQRRVQADPARVKGTHSPE